VIQEQRPLEFDWKRNRGRFFEARDRTEVMEPSGGFGIALAPSSPSASNVDSKIRTSIFDEGCKAVSSTVCLIPSKSRIVQESSGAWCGLSVRKIGHR